MGHPPVDMDRSSHTSAALEVATEEGILLSGQGEEKTRRLILRSRQ